MIPLIKGFSIFQKFSANKKIESRNEDRSLKRFDHIRDPAQFPDDASDDESVISMNLDDLSLLQNADFVKLNQSEMPKYIQTFLLKRKAADIRKSPPWLESTGFTLR